MASFDSHPQGVSLSERHLLGMNKEELAKNRLAHSHRVQDLNQPPKLPFDSESFDAIVSTAAIEYLTDPRSVLRQAWRVLRSGGAMLLSFSNRWFHRTEHFLFPGLATSRKRSIHQSNSLFRSCVYDLGLQSLSLTINEDR
jgi:ubiquinone/menaquinone biosynthesis C-methylase UbiE